MSIEAWAHAARRANYRQDVMPQNAINTLQTLLEGNTNPDSAAVVICSPYEAALKRGLYPVAPLWAIICEAARAAGGDKELADRLVDLLNSISQLPDVMDEHGKAITCSWSSGIYWRDLPEMGVMFREYAIEAVEEEDIEDHWNEEAGPLINATTFGAIYLTRGRHPNGMLFHAANSLRRGVEVLYQTPKEQESAVMYVPTAATWLLFGGEKIYEACKSGYERKDSDKGSSPKDEEWVWKGTGYSLGRWALWKKRFAEIAMNPDLKKNVTEISGKAAAEMARIDSQM